MRVFSLFKISHGDRNLFCEKVIESSMPKADFYFMVILSTLIVTFGLIKNNVILVIGGMLVTPILSSILAVSLGLVIVNLRLIFRSLRIFTAAFLLAVLVSYITSLFNDFNLADITLIKLMEPTLYTFVVALVAGAAASLAWVKPNLSSALPGIAITVTLIPPLTAIGLAFAKEEWQMAGMVFNVFILNIVGILLASLLMLILMKFYKNKRKLMAELKEEAKVLSKEI